jgi:hypothetical protein
MYCNNSDTWTLSILFRFTVCEWWLDFSVSYKYHKPGAAGVQRPPVQHLPFSNDMWHKNHLCSITSESKGHRGVLDIKCILSYKTVKHFLLW